jgi:hypothetical protein
LTNAGPPAYAFGLVPAQGPTVWEPFLPPASLPPAFDLPRVVQDLLQPFFFHREITDFSDFENQLAALTETVTYETAVPPSPDEKTEVPYSRRELLRGELDPDKPPPPRRTTVTETRGLPPALRYTLSRLLIKTAAAARGIPLIDLLVEIFGAPKQWRWVGIQAAAEMNSVISRQLIAYPIDALALRIPAAQETRQRDDLAAELRQYHQLMTEIALIRNLRKLCRWEGMPDLRRLLGGNMGDLMGLFLDLKKVAHARRLFVLDPIVHEETVSWVKDLRRLRESKRMTGVQIGVAARLDDVETIRELALRRAVDFMALSGARLGSLSALVVGIRQCRQVGAEVTLYGGREDGRFLAHLALVLQPDRVQATHTPTVSAGLITLYNEMAQTLTAQLAAQPCCKGKRPIRAR